ncbi:sugar ABC transporter permease [Arcanobacterium hippocoleae]
MEQLKRKINTQARRRLFVGVFLAPAIALFALIYAYPLVTVIYTSFCKWNYKNFLKPEFLGFDHLFDNYIKLFTLDANFQIALVNSIKWVLLSVLIQVPFSIIVALVLSKRVRGWKFARNVYIIPNIISTAAIGLIFLQLYSPGRGAISQIIQFFFPDKDIAILTNPASAFWGVTFAFILFGGTYSLLILTQIASIDSAILEAAKLDGANERQIDCKIILPLIKPMIGTVTVVAANYALLLYNEVALITAGGPGNSTYTLSYYIYKTAIGSEKLNFARGNTAGVIQLVLGLVLVGIINYLFIKDKKKVNNG